MVIFVVVAAAVFDVVLVVVHKYLGSYSSSSDNDSGDDDADADNADGSGRGRKCKSRSRIAIPEANLNDVYSSRFVPVQVPSSSSFSSPWDQPRRTKRLIVITTIINDR